VDGTRRRDEIGSLARAIERLGVSVRVAMRRLAKRHANAPSNTSSPTARRVAGL